MKKIQYLLCVATLVNFILFGAAQAAYAVAPASNTIVFTLGSDTYSVNGQVYSMDVTPVIVGGRTMLPIKYVANALGIDDAGISWDPASKVVTLDGPGLRIFVKVGARDLYTMDSTSNVGHTVMDVAPAILNSRTYLPAKYVAEALGYQVTWDAADNRVIITGSAPVNSAGPGSGSKTYTSAATGLSFSYPATWLTKQDDSDPGSFALINPADGSNLGSDVLPGLTANPMPLDALGKLIISQLNNTTPDGYNVPITNVSVLSTQDTEIDHLPAVAITFTATIGFIDEKAIFYLTQSGRNVYLFGGEATVATFDQDQAAWAAVLGTVSITTAGLPT